MTMRSTTADQTSAGHTAAETCQRAGAGRSLSPSDELSDSSEEGWMPKRYHRQLRRVNRRLVLEDSSDGEEV